MISSIEHPNSADGQVLDFDWPREIVLGPNKALVVGGRAYVGGETIRFYFEPLENSLKTEDGMVTKEYALAEASTDPREHWLTLFAGMFTKASGRDGISRARAVMDRLGKSPVLDQQFEVQYNEDSIQIKFLESRRPMLVAYPKYVEGSFVEDAERRAHRFVSYLEKWSSADDTSSAPFVWISGASTDQFFWDEGAKSVISLLEEIREKGASRDALERAQQLGIAEERIKLIAEHMSDR
jgi:hypothetical protein